MEGKHEDGTTTSVKKRFERANQDIIGKALNELWYDKIARVKRGPIKFSSI